MIVVSPYAKTAYVSHKRHEFGSILKFIEEVFNLPPIGPSSAGYTDSRAQSLSDSFDFSQQPRTFTPFPTKYPREYFLHEPPSDQPVDEE